MEEAMNVQGRWAALAMVSLMVTLAAPAGAATSTIGYLQSQTRAALDRQLQDTLGSAVGDGLG
jgi:hypothetical protein